LFLKSPPALILASTSVYRRELMTRLRLPFSCIAPGIDEARGPGERPLALATRLARAKADAVSRQHPDAWVVGSDQIAARAGGSADDVILGKPGTEALCIDQLRSCSGHSVSFLTAVAVVRQDRSAHEFVDTSRVTFRTLDDATIARYVALEMPIDCAGGFKSEGLGITLCESIDSLDPSALIGLPLIRLCAVLRSVGFELP
jgi:septum formation protein